jgi:site-specific DNA recombinase
MSKRAILYARVSGDDRKNATSSIDGQLTECRKYAEQRGYRVVGEAFEDPDKHTSGADSLPELEKLIRLAPTGTFDLLICREVDRLARNRFKQLATEIELERHGIRVEYAVGQFEDNDEGRLLKGLVSEFAEYERGKIRRRTTNGKLRSVEAGNVTCGGSVAPFGYDLVTVDGKRVLVINDQEAAVVRLLFDLYAIKGRSLYEIREYLDRHRVPLPVKGNNHRKRSKGEVWSCATISRLLSQETYSGHWHYRKTRRTKDAKTGKVHSVPRPRDEWLEVDCPAIISRELFEVAQQRKKTNKVLKGHQRRHFYALGGMVRCGRCNCSMAGMTKYAKGSEYQYHGCNAHRSPKRYGFHCDNAQVKASVLQAAVWGWIKSLLLEPEQLHEAIENYQQQQRERIQPQLSMLESTQTRLAELEGRKARLIDAYTKNVLSLDELASQKTALDKQIADLGQAIASLHTETEPQLLTAERIESIETIATKIRQGASIADGNHQAQRAIFQLLDVHVTVDGSGKQRWADVTCTFGNERCAVEYTSIDRM